MFVKQKDPVKPTNYYESEFFLQNSIVLFLFFIGTKAPRARQKKKILIRAGKATQFSPKQVISICLKKRAVYPGAGLLSS
jgi:hypothetical protein